ncbi:MAG: KpsF/GutQ family sugar-phosphate isomerase [Candidatus Kapaibacterium sp.]
MDIIKEARRVLTEEAKALEILSNSLDERFVDACQQIQKASKVIISGVGKSGIVGKKIAATFSSVGIPSLFLHPVEALHGDLGIVNESDISILISKSGTTEELLLLLPYLKKRTNIIAITTNKDSYLANNSDVHLHIPLVKEACPIELAPTTSTTLTMALGDALAASVMKLNNFTEVDFALNHPLGQLGKNLTITVGDVMHKGNSIPLIDVDSTFKDALIVMTDKPLGCLCVVENNKLVGIITDGDTRRALNRYDLISEIQINEIMTANPITVSPDTLVGRALSVMENRKSQINVLPVVDTDNRCIGVVRIHDLIKSGI